ncbi:hypothetical protein P154DRAFT_517292 [Amniculicola lignicola CBS 123094]|uniref:Stress response protein NST1 n=1 Tax=Amniculicola lignicola CBS 123094 TaxID=1392246 RepID=A0A6A5X0P4_9PLEO|nr:hypothetical protein P154DRAFT_517292 [Amniculicola lignicola CBS 123094]
MAHGTKAPVAAPTAPSNGVSSSQAPAASGVNRKKQKRREKQAAKQAAEAQKLPPAVPSKNGHVAPVASSTSRPQPPSGPPAPRYAEPDLDEPSQYDDDGDYYSDEDPQQYDHTYGTNGHYQPGYTAAHMAGGVGKKSKKKGKPASTSHDSAYAPAAAMDRHPSDPTLLPGRSKDRIWNTNTDEERARIREFWLSLGEEERKSLVKIEKEAVLRKMKEQQKHSCSCTVCGRKRTAIEEELEVLYDAYYEELEQYANHRQDPSLLPTDHFEQVASHVPHRPRIPPPDRSQDEDDYDDQDEDDQEEYMNSEDEAYDYSSEEPSLHPHETEFLQFGSSLQVKGGILTVADDLLKNDGKKFIEMMEQLAERRMQREEEAQYNSHPSMYKPHSSHSHNPPPEEDDYDDEEDDEEGYEDGDYEDDEEEDDTMTEEQRMEEGRRMFQIFAARMFEQRVLQAYKEKVAAERQQRLLEELAEEDDKKEQREAKKAKEAQKKKEKKEKQKQAKAEEKAKKDAEKAAQEAEVKAAEEKRLEEQRKKKEEQRRKKEAERKAQEEEKQRKEIERLKRQKEDRERQQEAERKAQAEKRVKEEAKRKEREEREAKEKEVRERKMQEERDRKERERENKARADKERSRKEEQAAIAAHKKNPQQIAVPLAPALLKQNSSAGIPSPHVTPALPKAPTPNRPRQSSQQDSHSHGSSPKTPQIAPGTSKSMSPASQAPNLIVPKSILTKTLASQQPAPSHHVQPASPLPPMGPPPGMSGPVGMGINNMPPGLNGFSHPQGPMLPGMMPRHGAGLNMPMFPPQPGSQNYRSFAPPGMPPPNPMPIGRGFPLDGPPGFPPFGGASPIPGFGMGMPSHSRQTSGSYEKPNIEPISAPQAQPISRPQPIQRPSSVKPHDENKHPQQRFSELDELADHLGSKALLDDADDEVEVHMEPRRTSMQAQGSLRGAPLGFGFSDLSGPPRADSYAPFGGSSNPGSVWSTPPMPFPMGSAPGWGTSPTTNIFNNPFHVGAPRPGERRLAWVRRMVCVACKSLGPRYSLADGSLDASEVIRHIESTRTHAEAPVTQQEVKQACDVIGDAINGGGSLDYKELDPATTTMASIKFMESGGLPSALGEIGSPLPSHSLPVGGFSGRPFPGLGPQGF